MLLLNVDLTSPQPIAADSLHLVAQNMVQQMVSNPSTFWPELGRQAIHFGLKVLVAIIIYVVGYYCIRYIKKLLEQVFLSRKTERTLASFVVSLVSIALTVILVILTIDTLGIDTTSLAALLAAGGMAIGMALSGTVQNFAGGIMLLIFKPFKSGDYIVAQGVSGTVIEVLITSTKILTVDNRLVVLPNGALSNGIIENYSAQVLRRVDFEVSVAYGTDVEAFKKAVLSFFEGDERILDHTCERGHNPHKSGVKLTNVSIPDPFVALKSLNGSDITFTIRVWVNNVNYWSVYFGYLERFYTELPQMGFSFAYPHMDVQLHSPVSTTTSSPS